MVLLYDNNQVTCDGPLDWINTEDINAKMRACGWQVLDVADGRYDAGVIVNALELARQNQRVDAKPVFINIRTVIVVDTANAGTAKAHHGAFDKESIARSKILAGIPPNSTHVVPDKALQFFRERKSHGVQIEQEWNDLVARYAQAHPDKAAAFSSSRRGELGNPAKILERIDATQFKGMPTRKINGIILERLWKETTALCGGGADLVTSNNLRYAETDIFDQNVSLDHMSSISHTLKSHITNSHIKALLRPLYTLWHPRTRNGSHLQRHRRLQPRHIPSRHGHLFHVLHLRKP